jgi:hypothetical protein
MVVLKCSGKDSDCMVGGRELASCEGPLVGNDVEMLWGKDSYVCLATEGRISGGCIVEGDLKRVLGKGLGSIDRGGEHNFY